MNATARQRVLYADWLKWLTRVAEFPAHGNRHSADARARRQAAANSVRKLEVEMEYD